MKDKDVSKLISPIVILTSLLVVGLTGCGVPKDDSISIIGGADGPTSVFIASNVVKNGGTASNQPDADGEIVNTYEVTDADLSEKYFEEDKLVTMVRYYEMSDGTWKTDDHAYKYRLEITGRMPNAAKDSTFVYLSNVEEISFERAYMAAGLSSNMDDYFALEDAVLVAMK